MPITRRGVRQAIIDQGWFDALYATATSATTEGTQTLVATLAAGGQSAGKYGRLWQYRPSAANAGDQLRVLEPEGFQSSSGMFRHQGPAWTENPLVNGDSGYFELWPYDPRVVNECIERALTDLCWSLQQDDVTTDGSQRYQLAAAPFPLTKPAAVHEILAIEEVIGSGATALVRPWNSAGRSWRAESDAGTYYIRFYGTPRSQTLRIYWRKSYTAFSDDAVDTETVPDNYIKWASLVELFRTLNRKAEEVGRPNDNYRSLLATAWEKYLEEHRKELTDRFAGPIVVIPQQSHNRVTAPRMGRW